MHGDPVRGHPHGASSRAGDIDLGGLRNDAGRQVGELVGMQIHHAAGDHDKGLARLRQGMSDGLARLGLGLARHRAGVDDDEVGLVLLDQGKAGLQKIGGDAIGFDAVYPAPEIHNASERSRHVCSVLVENVIDGVADAIAHGALLFRHGVFARSSA